MSFLGFCAEVDCMDASVWLPPIVVAGAASNGFDFFGSFFDVKSKSAMNLNLLYA